MTLAAKLSFLVGTLSAACAPIADDSQASNLVEPFVSALGSRHRARLRDFVDRNFRTSWTTDQWMERLWGFAENAAPLKLIKVRKARGTNQEAEFEDRHGQRWGLRMELSGDPPKIVVLQITDPASLDSRQLKDYSGWKDLESLAASIRADTQCPAIGVAVWEEGKPMRVVVDGVRTLGRPDKVEPGDPWHIGSIGKSMTATLIAKLIEKGKLRWETTLREALPDVPMKPEYASVTLEQIMRHRGGIPRDMTFTQLQVDAICGTETDPVRIRERYVRNVLGREPIAKPGERFAYSNAGYAILGHIAEKIGGKPFEELMREQIFEPLGMESARVGKLGLPIERPVGHVQGEKGLVPFDLGGKLGMMIAPAGDMWCSLADLARYARMHLDGLRGRNGLLRSKTVERLHNAVLEDAGGAAYACGWSVGPLQGTSVRHGHNGSNGTFCSEMAIFPAEGLTVVSIVNCGPPGDPSPPMRAVLAVGRRYAPAGGRESSH